MSFRDFNFAFFITLDSNSLSSADTVDLGNSMDSIFVAHRDILYATIITNRITFSLGYEMHSSVVKVCCTVPILAPTYIQSADCFAEINGENFEVNGLAQDGTCFRRISAIL